MKVEGKVAVVTGAASGIGRAIARRFAREERAGGRGGGRPDRPPPGGRRRDRGARGALRRDGRTGGAGPRRGGGGALRPDRRLLLERGGRERWRRGGAGRGVAAELRPARHGPRVRGPGGGSEDGRPRERVPRQYRLRGGAPHPCRVRDLRGHQACGGRPGRVPCHRLRRSRGARLGALPAGGAHGDDLGGARREWRASMG